MHAKPPSHSYAVFRYVEDLQLDGDISVFGKSRNRKKMSFENI
jgi:hypothetical protein